MKTAYEAALERTAHIPAAEMPMPRQKATHPATFEEWLEMPDCWGPHYKKEILDDGDRAVLKGCWTAAAQAAMRIAHAHDWGDMEGPAICLAISEQMRVSEPEYD